MHKVDNRKPDTRRIALVALLSASAAMISIGTVSFPFPLLPFLRFDAAEVPDVLSFFLLGPTGGLVVTLIHWIILDLHSSFDPIIGPTMKFMAVFGTMLGLYVATFLVPEGTRGKRLFLALLGVGTLVRFVVMIPPTFLLYYFISPGLYLPFAEKSLTAFGIHASGTLAAATLVTLVTALFNILHALFTVSVVWLVYQAAVKSGAIRFTTNWLASQVGLFPEQVISQGE